MTISSVDTLIAAMIGQPQRFFHKAATVNIVAARPVSLWPIAGIPGAGVQDTNGLPGTAWDCSSGLIAGQLPFYNPGSGNSYLSRFVGAVPNGGAMLLCDRLWSNSGITINSTSLQTVSSVAFPARDNNAAVSGEGVFLGIEVSGQTGTGAPVITVKYTNSAGVSGQTGTNIPGTQSSTPIGHFFPISLQAGDIGVQSVQSIQLSATWTSGTINMVAYRVITTIEVGLGGGSAAVDPVTGGLPQMWNGTVPFVIYYSSAVTPANSYGSLSVAQG